MTSTHFVTEVTITKVEEIDPKPGYGAVGSSEGRRRKSTIARVVVSHANLDELKRLAAAHLDLVADGGDIDKDGAAR